jgi:hypothetical protein
MRIKQVILLLNEMRDEGVIGAYAIGGAVGATFYLEPAATLDVDIFVALEPRPGSLIIDPGPLFYYLTSRGYIMEGEYFIVAGWPVQFLPPTGPLVQEALQEAKETDVEGAPAHVFRAEHLAAICLETGRAKDKARLLQFIETGVLNAAMFEEIVERHGLTQKWHAFGRQFMEETS